MKNTRIFIRQKFPPLVHGGTCRIGDSKKSTTIPIPPASSEAYQEQNIRIDNQELLVIIESKLESLTIQIGIDSEAENLIELMKEKIDIAVFDENDLKSDDRFAMDGSYGIYHPPLNVPDFFAIRLSREDGIKELNKYYKNKDKVTSFVVDGLTHHRGKIELGSLVFVVASGWKSAMSFSYTQGLYGVAKITSMPYNIEDKAYVIDVQFVYFFDRVLSRQDFLEFPETADIPFIGPSTKGTKTQAISTMSQAQAEAVLRASQLMTQVKFSSFAQYFPWFFKTSYGLSEKKFTKMTDSHTPSLNVTAISKVFAEFIRNYSHEETATMMGIFGRWGRGKTFFYKEVKKAIQKDHKSGEKFYFCEFQPWKYQEKESAWAYLYQTILNNYLDADPWKWGFYHIKKYIKLTWLNLQKIGLFKIFAFLLSLLGLYLLAGYLPELSPKISDKVPDIIKPLGGIGIMLYLLYSMFKDYKNVAISTVNKYTKNHYFSNKLGFQNEIQEELKLLLKIFINKPQKEKLILFIDDLDRCNEEMLINIIDSLRLMLDDKEIRERVLVLTALDERILLKSIKHKYLGKGKDNDDIKISSREYIEKFFLMGIKLDELNENDIMSLVDDYTSTINSLHIDFALSEIEEVETRSLERAQISDDDSMEGVEAEIDDAPLETEEDQDAENNVYIMRTDEQEYLKDHMRRVENVTPRKVNMLIHRYLFFKALAFELLDREILSSIDSKLYIDLIFLIDKEELFEGEQTAYDLIAKKIKQNSTVVSKFEINENEYEIPTIEALKLLKITEMVSPF